MTLHETPPDSRWIRHSRIKYTAMLGLFMVEIERVGKRWHTSVYDFQTGEILQLETRSPLSVAIQQAESAVAQAATRKGE